MRQELPVAGMPGPVFGVGGDDKVERSPRFAFFHTSTMAAKVAEDISSLKCTFACFYLPTI